MKNSFSFNWRIAVGITAILGLFSFSGGVKTSFALELDWSGQFWSEANFVSNYSMGNQLTTQSGGYAPVSGSNRDAFFQSLFLRLWPKVIVNDNIYIKSEWWLGDPVFGLFGNSLPYTPDQNQYYTSFSRGAPITAQRYWGELVTDLGTVQVGRVPLHWGLGIVWDRGDDLWSRYMSTGDAVRWIAKFGSFSFVPSLITRTTGNTIGGSCTFDNQGVCQPGSGVGSVTDYSIILKYENLEEELEGGLNILKTLGGFSQDPTGDIQTPSGSGSLNYVTYDFYAKKKFNRLTLGAEVPVANGSLGSTDYSTYAFAGEADYRALDSLSVSLKAGMAPGQPNSGGSKIDTFRAFSFHPNYHLGMIMFNYQLSNFSQPQTLNSSQASSQNLRSPYDNPITNATYASLSAKYRPWDKWTFRPTFVFARALQGASASSQYSYFYNTQSRSVQKNQAGKEQGLNLGWEFDLGATFQWDDNFRFHLDGGVFSPGNFFAFSNTANDNSLNLVVAISARAGVSF